MLSAAAKSLVHRVVVLAEEGDHELVELAILGIGERRVPQLVYEAVEELALEHLVLVGQHID